jgi:hypothetical protein
MSFRIRVTSLACLWLVLCAGLLPYSAYGITTRISARNMVGFPEVHLFVQVLNAAGAPIQGLNESNFQVTVNGQFANPDVTTAPNGGTNFGLALDCSGSMVGYQNQVITACTTFVSTMLPLDQAAVVFFEDYYATRVVQPMTNDHNLLKNAIMGYYIGGGTAMWYGFTQAINECKYEVLPRCMIGFTDGGDNSSGSYTQATVTLLAQTSGTQVSSIGIGGVSPGPLIQVANATGGTYIQTTIDSLGWYYQQLQIPYRYQYEVAYVDPVPLFNGQLRTVIVTASDGFSSAADTDQFNAPWTPNFAPHYTLTPHTQDTLLVNSQPAGAAATVTAWITDDDVLTKVMIRHRPIGETFYRHGEMTHVSDSLYSFTFAPWYVQSPGIEFYMLATDGYNHTVASPTYRQSQYPYQVAVQPNVLPQVTHTPVTTCPPAVPLTLSCTAVDSTLNVASAKIWYRNKNEIFWNEIAMTNTVGNTWSGTIPGNVLDPFLNLYYSLRISDNYGTTTVKGPYYVDVGPDPLHLTLTPLNPPIQIPASGGSFGYNIAVSNTGHTPMSFAVWNKITLPNGVNYGPVLGPVELTLVGGAAINRNRTQTIPGTSPPGSYVYKGYLGIYPAFVWTGDSFEFEKLTTGTGPLVEQWNNYGESFSPWETVASQPLPAEFGLTGIHPNPFNLDAAIAFTLPMEGQVSLKIYDISGRMVATLVDGRRVAGTHEVHFNGAGLASGVYLCRLETGLSSATAKMVLLK